MDFAIIEAGGRQYKITPNKILSVEKMPAVVGGKMVFDKVLLISDGEDVKIGTPYLEGETVEVDVLEHYRDKKVVILKFRAKASRYRRHAGHRQSLTNIKLTVEKPVVAKEAKADKKTVVKAKTVKAKKVVAEAK